MRRIKYLIAIALCALTLTGCGNSNEDDKSKAQMLANRYADIAASKSDGLDNVTKAKLEEELRLEIGNDAIILINYNENKSNEVCVDIYVSEPKTLQSNFEVYGFAQRKDSKSDNNKDSKSDNKDSKADNKDSKADNNKDSKADNNKDSKADSSKDNTDNQTTNNK